MAKMMKTTKFNTGLFKPGPKIVLFSWPHSRIHSDPKSVSLVSVPTKALVHFRSPSRQWSQEALQSYPGPKAQERPGPNGPASRIKRKMVH